VIPSVPPSAGAWALALAAADREATFTWLDGGLDGGVEGGGAARGWLGLRATEEIVADDLAVLDEVERLWRADRRSVWLGWITYDLGARPHLARTPRGAATGAGAPGRLPGLCLRRFESAWSISGDRLDPIGRPSRSGPDPAVLPVAPRWPFERLKARLAPQEYRARVEAARRFIAAGDTYQINLSQRFDAPWQAGAGSSADAVAAYAWLRERAPASMGGLVRFGGGWILSNSPETLVDVRLGDVDVARSWPIKGTRPRGREADDDAEQLRALVDSAKDRAEHVMIVDLVRNDLGRLARPGTVRAAPRPTAMTLPTVHHLVTEVRADLRPGWTLRELVESVFPGGSITGAPKSRTIALIDELEHEPRELYCGSLVVLEPGGLRFDIAIRTAIVDAAGIDVRGGGGVVIDSDPESERLETLAKVRAFDPSRSSYTPPRNGLSGCGDA
jgi:para-aminobenzoate synthetase component I